MLEPLARRGAVGQQSQVGARKDVIVVSKAFAASPNPSMISRIAATGLDGESGLRAVATDTQLYAELTAIPQFDTMPWRLRPGLNSF